MLRELLGVPEGRGWTAARLVTLVFGVSCAFAPLKSAQSALFLSAYDADLLPWAFAASAFVLAAASAVNVAVGARVGPVALASATLVAFGVLFPVLWLLQPLHPAMAFLTYIAVEVCVGLLIIHTWSVVSEATNARSAKRLLPLAGVGTSLAWTLGGAAVPALAPLVGERGLLLVAPFSFLLALAALRAIVNRDLAGRAARGHSNLGLLQGWRRGMDFVRETPLMRIVAVLSVFALVGEQLMDLQLLQAVEEGLDPDAVAGFLGLYYSASSLVALVFSLLFAGRLLDRLGSTKTLMATPTWMVIGAAIALMVPGLLAATALRGVYRVLKQALWSSSMVQAQVPLPVVRRAQARALIRGVIAPMGYAASALLVGALNGVSGRWLALATVALGVVMVAMATQLRGAYSRALQGSVDARRLVLQEKPSRPQLGAATVHQLEQSLRSGPTLQAGLAVEMLASSDEPSAFRSVSAATHHRSAVVRAAAVTQIARMGRSTGAPLLAHMLGRDEDVSVRRACVRALASLGTPAQGAALEKALQDEDATVRGWARVARAAIAREPATHLLRHPEPAVREAAVLGLKTTALEVEETLNDPVPAVRAAAVRAALKHPSLLPRTLAALEDPALVPAVAQVLPGLGPELIRELSRGVDKASPRAVRNLALACRRLKGNSAVLLLELLEHPHPVVREETTRALGAAVRDPDTRLPRDKLRPLQDQELALAWQLVTILGGLAHDDGSPDWVVNAPYDALGREVDHRLEACRKRLLCLLALGGERRLIGAYEVGLRGRTEEAQVAELVEVSLDREQGRSLVPLFAPQSLRERFTEGRRLERIAATAFHDPLGQLELLHDDALLGVAMVVYDERFRSRYPDKWEESLFARTQRLLFLREVPLFHALAVDDLHQVAAVLESRAVPAGATILKKGDPGDELLIIVEGQVRIEDGMELAKLGPRQFFGELSVIDHEPRAADAVALTDVTLLALRAADLDELMAHRPSIQEEILRELARRLRVASSKVASR